MAFRMAAPIAVPRAVVRVSMRRTSCVAVGGRRHDELGEAGEGHDADAGAVGLVLHELRGPPPAPRSAGSGCTSVAHIERDTSRARMIEVRPSGTVGRRPAGGPRPRRRPARPPSSSADGHVALPAGALRQRGADQRDAREAHRLLAAAAQLPHVGAEQQRHRQQGQQGQGPGEGHGYTTRPNQASDSAAPTNSSSAATPASRPVTSVRSCLGGERRSIVS